MVKSACGIEAVYMCFNGTGIWGGETIFPSDLTTFHVKSKKDDNVHDPSSHKLVEL